MGLFVGSTPVNAVYVGSTPVKAVYVGAQKVWPTSEVHQVTITNATGMGTVHPLVSVTVPAGETWDVWIQGTVTEIQGTSYNYPLFRIGATDSGGYGKGAAVDFSGTVTAANSTIAMVTNAFTGASFTGTVTIEKAAPPSGGRYAWEGSTGRVPESGNLPSGLTPLITHTVTAPGTTTATVSVTFDYEWPDVEATIELTKNGVVIGTRVPDLNIGPTQSLTVVDVTVATGDIIELRIKSDTQWGAWYPALSSSLTLA